jgi:ABC-type Fe3+-hydroxamate transport system substrate-binding protein
VHSNFGIDQLDSYRFFPVFTYTQGQQNGLEEYQDEIRSFSPDLLLVPNGTLTKFKAFPGQKIELSDLGIASLSNDVRIVGTAVGYEKEAEIVADGLFARSQPLDGAQLPTGVWITGAVDVGPGFVNMAVEGSAAGRLFSKRFRNDPLLFDITLDDLVRLDPDVTLYTDAVRNVADPRSLSADKRWTELRAVKRGRVFQMEPTDGLGFGPRHVEDFLRIVDETEKLGIISGSGPS